MIGAGRGADDQPGAHRRRLSDDREQAPADHELLEEGARQQRRGAGENDHFVGSVHAPAARRVADFQRDVLGAVALEIAAAELGQRGLHLDRVDVRGAVREERGQIAASGADFQHAVGALAHGQLLEDPRFHLGLPHALALAERDVDIGEGERAVLRKNELLARHQVQQIEHVLIEHLPGADLLLDHVEARLL